jgi:ubiquinone/menaquinone biosynthesis C-methylase UbiE
MDEKIFDPKKLNKLNNPQRLLDLPPQYIWEKLDLKLDAKAVFVDIGAGTGFYSIPFSQYIKDGKLFACDISDIMVDWMKTNLIHKYPNIVPLIMRDNEIPVENSSADLVFMIYLHHELNKPEKMLEESLKLLKEGGKICIIDWKKEEMPMGPPLSIRFLPETVKKQLGSVGFEKIDIDNKMSKHFMVIASKPLS